MTFTEQQDFKRKMLSMSIQIAAISIIFSLICGFAAGNAYQISVSDRKCQELRRLDAERDSVLNYQRKKEQTLLLLRMREQVRQNDSVNYLLFHIRK